MASISEAERPTIDMNAVMDGTNEGRTPLDSSVETEGEHHELPEEEAKYNPNRRKSQALFTDVHEKDNPLG